MPTLLGSLPISVTPGTYQGTVFTLTSLKDSVPTVTTLRHTEPTAATLKDSAAVPS